MTQNLNSAKSNAAQDTTRLNCYQQLIREEKYSKVKNKDQYQMFAY